MRVVLLFLLGGTGLGMQRPDGLPADVSEKDLQGVVITLKTTACYGSCPVYSVEIRGDGTVTFKGVKFVTMKGEQHYTIPVERVCELVAEFYKIDFFALKDKYTGIVYPDGSVEFITDLSSATTTITIGGRTKSVYDYYRAPPALRALEKRIDEISGATKFIPRDQ